MFPGRSFPIQIITNKVSFTRFSQLSIMQAEPSQLNQSSFLASLFGIRRKMLTPRRLQMNIWLGHLLLWVNQDPDVQFFAKGPSAQK